MITSWICFGLGLSTGFFFVRSLYYKKKWEECKTNCQQLCGEINCARVVIENLNNQVINLQNENRLLSETNRDYKHLIASGCRNLKTREWVATIKGNELVGGISVVNQDTRRKDLWFTIKDFGFNPDKPEDREFAIREAEELLETIKKA